LYLKVQAEKKTPPEGGVSIGFADGSLPQDPRGIATYGLDYIK
jgi:hypothetical protein